MLDFASLRERANAANVANAATQLTPEPVVSRVATLAAVAVPQRRPYALSQAEADAAHAQPWDDAACARFVARVVLFLRRGVNATAADDAAERAHLADIERDDRRACIECAHLRGVTCGNAATAGIGRDLPPELSRGLLLHRCPGFHPEVPDDA